MSEKLARLFHETYERLAPSFGYETRKESAVPWEEVPERNKQLMIAVADIIELDHFGGERDEQGGRTQIFATQAGYGFNTKEPYVGMTFNGLYLAQLPPENAIALAHGLLEAAQLSITDSFVIEFFREEVNLEEKELNGMLHQYRVWLAHRREHLARGEDHHHHHD